jgi:two-component system NarL family response regulator
VVVGQSINLFLVEDSKFMAFAVRKNLESVADFNFVGFAQDGQKAVAEIIAVKPAVAIIDIGLPGLDGIEVTRLAKEAVPGLKVIVLTGSSTTDDIVNALDAGADGYVLKEGFGERLEMAIRSVRVGAVWLDPEIAKQLVSRFPKSGPKSTSTELQKLGEVADSECADGVCLVEPDFLKKVQASLSQDC